MILLLVGANFSNLHNSIPSLAIATVMLLEMILSLGASVSSDQLNKGADRR